MFYFCIKMIEKINNNISFKARFRFNGTKSETSSFVKFIEREIADTYSKDAPVSVIEQDNFTMIFTGFDAKHPNNDSDFINANDFYDKEKDGFLPEIIDFDPIFGFYEKIHSKVKKGITSFFQTSHGSSGEMEADRKIVPKLDFNRNTGLDEALDLASEIAKLGGHDLAKYKEVIQQSDRFKDLKVNGVAGIGQESIIFDIDNNSALKLSMWPCYPQKPEEFDLPIIEKGCIQSRAKRLYYCITPKAKNNFDGKIKREDVVKIMNMIEGGGYKTNDICPEHYKQIVIYQGKPYLCDYDCARLPSGESRLYSMRLC